MLKNISINEIKTMMYYIGNIYTKLDLKVIITIYTGYGYCICALHEDLHGQINSCSVLDNAFNLCYFNNIRYIDRNGP